MSVIFELLPQPISDTPLSILCNKQKSPMSLLVKFSRGEFCFIRKHSTHDNE